MNTEIWKPVAGFEGAYEVSSAGRVRSLDRDVQMLSRWGSLVTKRLRGRILKPGLDGNGYLFVFLGSGNIRRVHRLVADAFVEGEGPVVNHLNGKRDEPGATNLEWTSCSGNNLHAFRVLGRAPSNVQPVLVSGQGMGQWFPSVRQAAKQMGWAYQSIYWALKNSGRFCGFEVAHG